MRLVNPIGKEKIATIADFIITPYGGCACSSGAGLNATAAIELKPPFVTCACQCSHGSANQTANNDLGHH